MLRSWARSRDEVEADELRREAEEHRSQPISSCQAGEVVAVSGTVRSLSLRPRGDLPAFEIELYDGSGTIKVIWIGRRQIRGIEAGRRLLVRGRLTCVTGGPTIYNPRYELKPVAG